MSSSKRTEIRLSIDASNPNLPEVILLNYLRGDGKPRSYRDTILSALKAFWLPVALIDKGAGEQVIYQATIDALYALILQLKYLEQKTGIKLSITGDRVLRTSIEEHHSTDRRPNNDDSVFPAPKTPPQNTSLQKGTEHSQRLETTQNNNNLSSVYPDLI